MKNIEITIPVLNEAATLEAQIRAARDYIHAELKDLAKISIVIADNGSVDETSEIAARLAHEFYDVFYLRLEERGVGRALKKSWGDSSADIVGYMDLDLATGLDHLKDAFVPLLRDDADIVSGSRLAAGAQVIGRSLLRTFVSNDFNMMVRIYFRTSFTDGMCGFKFLKRDKLKRLIDAGATNDGWFFSTELLVCAESLEFRYKDIPVTWTDDQNSKVRIGKLAVEYMRSMQRLKRHLRSKAAIL